ncbi:MAG: hypothetical protein V3U92_18085 [Cellulophaga sp.]
MEKNILLTLIVLVTITFSNDSASKIAVDDGVNQNLITYQISNNKVFSTII